MNDWEIKIKEKYPWPDVSGIQSYYFSFDGGGRDLIFNEIKSKNVGLILEIGCFLCGSTIQWLESSSGVKVIGVDPWEGEWVSPLEAYIRNPVMKPLFSRIPNTDDFLSSLASHGPYKSALANVRGFSDRFFPVKARSPEAIYDLRKIGVRPELIYFDNDKTMDDLYVCSDVFPDAVLTGDDWTWSNDNGDFVVRKAVLEFCESKNCKVEVSQASWIIRK